MRGFVFLLQHSALVRRVTPHGLFDALLKATKETFSRAMAVAFVALRPAATPNGRRAKADSSVKLRGFRRLSASNPSRHPELDAGSALPDGIGLAKTGKPGVTRPWRHGIRTKRNFSVKLGRFPPLSSRIPPQRNGITRPPL